MSSINSISIDKLSRLIGTLGMFFRCGLQILRRAQRCNGVATPEFKI